ncbi:SRPBCC domain-containing protein [Arthrobacter sp. ISL-69]|nr:SRPBCC domain-containing protein [Arthrobacter sp. ISL-69]
MTVNLVAVEGGTTVQLIHEGLTEQQEASHAEGWNHFLERLVLLATNGDAGPDEWAAAPDPIDELSSASVPGGCPARPPAAQGFGPWCGNTVRRLHS